MDSLTGEIAGAAGSLFVTEYPGSPSEMAIRPFSGWQKI
jgi:hypothetical protein